MKNIQILVGPPGSGKSTYAAKLVSQEGYVYVNQDLHGKEGHIDTFNQAILGGKDIVIDRMNFDKKQRERYLEPAKIHGYTTEIIVFHESFKTCLMRCVARTNHPTIKDQDTAMKALHMFFSKYERIEDNEADKVVRLWPEGSKPLAIAVDLDGTLCDIEHRLHFVTQDKPDWKSFFEGIKDDKVNNWCYDLVKAYSEYTGNSVVLCSGRPNDYRQLTQDWLSKVTPNLYYDNLFMREQGDYRSDAIIKQIILDFEIRTRYNLDFVVDDRPVVCRMWRNNNIICLQCNDKEF